MKIGGGGVRGSLLAVAFLSACSSGSHAADGGGSEGTASTDASDAGASGDGATTACDPAAQDCPAGMKCDFLCDGTTAALGCRIDPGDGQTVGQACATADYCARGASCVAVAPTTATCKKYCVSDADCPTGQCHAAMVGFNCGAGTTLLSLKLCY